MMLPSRKPDAEVPDEEKVNPPVDLHPFEDPALNWRVEQLVYAGANIATAEKVAEDRSIDLHYAVGLFRSAGNDLAEAILL
jgi:hypothetical protein